MTLQGLLKNVGAFLKNTISEKDGTGNTSTTRIVLLVAIFPIAGLPVVLALILAGVVEWESVRGFYEFDKDLIPYSAIPYAINRMTASRPKADAGS